MSVVLVIPDIHLKTHIISDADFLMQRYNLDTAVFLGDFCDDWNCFYNAKSYNDTFDALLAFKAKYPQSLFCWGNHDISYLDFRCTCSGHSTALSKPVIVPRIKELQASANPKIIHVIDDTVFSHAGVSQRFLRKLLLKNPGADLNKNLSYIADKVNSMPYTALWENSSPIWFRPYLRGNPGYAEYFQITGHTPVKKPLLQGNTWLLDTFSTYNDGVPYGNCSFGILNTVTHNITFVRDIDIKNLQ